MRAQPLLGRRGREGGRERERGRGEDDGADDGHAQETLAAASGLPPPGNAVRQRAALARQHLAQPLGVVGDQAVDPEADEVAHGRLVVDDVGDDAQARLVRLVDERRGRERRVRRVLHAGREGRAVDRRDRREALRRRGAHEVGVDGEPVEPRGGACPSGTSARRAGCAPAPAPPRATRVSTPQSKHWMLVRPTSPSISQRLDDLGHEGLAGGELRGVDGVVLDLEVDPHRVGAALAQQGGDLAQQRHRRREVGAGEPAGSGGRRRAPRRARRPRRPRAVRWTSSSSVETPSARARPKASRVFSGQQPGAPAVGLQVEGHV